MDSVEKSVGKTSGSTKGSLSFGIRDFAQEFFIGITHHKNMKLMTNFFEGDKVNLRENDFFGKFGL